MKIGMNEKIANLLNINEYLEKTRKEPEKEE
jgi:hypothetical protein